MLAPVFRLAVAIFLPVTAHRPRSSGSKNKITVTSAKFFHLYSLFASAWDGHFVDIKLRNMYMEKYLFDEEGEKNCFWVHFVVLMAAVISVRHLFTVDIRHFSMQWKIFENFEKNRSINNSTVRTFAFNFFVILSMN